MLAEAAATGASVTGVALFVAIASAVGLAMFQIRTAVGKGTTPSDPPPPRSEDPSYAGQMQ